MWNFLKEISTNGDMQTMDVVFPASPMLLYTNPELLRLLLVPVRSHTAVWLEVFDGIRSLSHSRHTLACVLRCAFAVQVLNFANNGTSTPFTNPFSPHQIGTYPIADATTASQEPMPMENTGNMFLMITGILQRTPGESRECLKPSMPMLTTWADFLVASLPFPANQLCTDDFVRFLQHASALLHCCDCSVVFEPTHYGK